ncbi:MAG TPA: VOC family protein [Gaiellaceae bacterium]|nr:VOC family protein [Gaiellaceae bacterium]
MFDHVTIRVSDLDASRRFYETLLQREPEGGEFFEWEEFGIALADEKHPVTQHLHVAFAVESRADVDAFWRRGVDAGYPSDGEPGPRPQSSPEYYGGFLLDPDGNSVEAVHARRTESGPRIDHLWLRVRDVDVSARFWETVADVLRLRLFHDLPSGFHVAAGNRSFALLRDERPRTEHVHLAFPVPDDETVAEFHHVATAAGFRDNGGPGERPEYHPGYVGAFVLDPDGNNVEAVNHNR